MTTWSAVLTYLPQGEANSDISVYAGNPYSEACGMQYDYTVLDGTTEPDDEEESIHDIGGDFNVCFREAK